LIIVGLRIPLKCLLGNVVMTYSKLTAEKRYISSCYYIALFHRTAI